MIILGKSGEGLQIAKKVIEAMTNNEAVVFTPYSDLNPTEVSLPYMNYVEDDYKIKDDPKSGKERRRERRKLERKLKKVCNTTNN